MENKKYQIFISSTYTDLIDARAKAMETILNIYHFPVGMEMFSAGDDEQWEIIKDTINVSDYYILIIGHRYGSTTDDGMGYTEKEYDYAKAKGIPILAFIRDRDTATKSHERECDPDKIEKLNKFIEKASANKMCNYWYDIDDLVTKIAIALPKSFARKPQIGWCRGGNNIPIEISNEMAKLSEENRLLREKIKKLEDTISIDKPEIYVKINNSEKLDIKIPTTIPNSITSIPPTISVSDIPSELHKFIKPDEIDNYNKSIPTQDKLDKHNTVLTYAHLATHCKLDLIFNIFNSGTKKANDINIIITFPDSVKLIDKSSFEDIQIPNSPIPYSLIEKLKSRKLESEKSAVLAASRTIHDLISPGHSNFTPAFLQSSYPKIHNLSRTLSDRSLFIYEEENRVMIKISGLLQSRPFSLDEDVAIIPLRVSSETIRVNIVCEEYKNSENIEIPITIEKI